MDGDAWFGSIPAVVELKRMMNVYLTFIVKQNAQRRPLQVIKKMYPSPKASSSRVQCNKRVGVEGSY